MKNQLATILSISVLTSYAASAAITVSTPFTYSVDAATSSEYATAPYLGGDGGADNLYSADTPISVTIGSTITPGSFTVGNDEKLVGVLNVHNSAARVGAVSNLQFGGTAMNVFNTTTSNNFTTSYMFYWDNSSGSAVVDGTLSFGFDVDFSVLDANQLAADGSNGFGLDEFSFTLYSLGGTVAGGPRGTGSGNNDAAAEVGDFLLVTAQRNNGGAFSGVLAGGAATSDLVLAAADGPGNLTAANAYGIATASLLKDDGGTNVTNDITLDGQTNTIRSIASFEAIPEPGTFTLLGITGLLFFLRRRR